MLNVFARLSAWLLRHGFDLNLVRVTIEFPSEALLRRAQEQMLEEARTHIEEHGIGAEQKIMGVQFRLGSYQPVTAGQLDCH